MVSYWARRRKITIQMTILVIVAVIISFGTFLLFKFEPSCTDGIQNQDEVGVDCGGSCPIECQFGVVPVKIVWNRYFELSDQSTSNSLYALVAYIENQNKDYTVNSADVVFDIYDEDGGRINTALIKTFIMPDGPTVAFVPFISTGVKKIVYINSYLKKSNLERSSKQYNITVTEKEFSNSRTSATALVTNEGSEDLQDMYFFVIIFDEDNNAIAASRDYEPTLRAGETKRLNYTWVYPWRLNVEVCLGGVLICPRKPIRMEIVPVQSID